MAIALIVLVPLAAGVALLGQYTHIKQQTQASARAAAWAATVSPQVAQRNLPATARVQNDLRARHFGNSDSVIASNAESPASFADPMLQTFAGQPLLEPSQVELATYSQETGPSLFDKALGLVGKVSDTLPPNPEGLVTAEVHARPELIKSAEGAPLAFMAPLDAEQLDFTAKTVLLADTWGAAGGGENKDGSPVEGAGNRTVRKVIRPLVPSEWAGDTITGGINDVIHLLGKVPILNKVLTTNWDKLEIGKVAPDAVPADKLVEYAK